MYGRYGTRSEWETLDFSQSNFNHVQSLFFLVFPCFSLTSSPPESRMPTFPHCRSTAFGVTPEHKKIVRNCPAMCLGHVTNDLTRT